MSRLNDRSALRVAPLFLAALLLVCQAPYVAANVAEGGGGSCTGVTESDGTQMLQQAYDDGLYTCSGGTYVPEALIVGGVTDTGATPSCSSTTAGMLYYTGGTIERSEEHTSELQSLRH